MTSVSAGHPYHEQNGRSRKARTGKQKDFPEFASSASWCTHTLQIFLSQLSFTCLSFIVIKCSQQTPQSGVSFKVSCRVRVWHNIFFCKQPCEETTWAELPAWTALFTLHAPMAPVLTFTVLPIFFHFIFFSSVCQIIGRNVHEYDPRRAASPSTSTWHLKHLFVPNRQRRMGQGWSLGRTIHQLWQITLH